MKKLTHLNKETGDFKPVTERYYFGKNLLLEVEDATGGACIGEHINIGGTEYLLFKVVQYPEILIIDYHITTQF